MWLISDVIDLESPDISIFFSTVMMYPTSPIILSLIVLAVKDISAVVLVQQSI